MKKQLKAMLEKKEARKAELGNKSNAATTLEELRSINTELESLNSEIAEMRGLLDSMPEENDNEEMRDQFPNDQPNQRGGSMLNGSKILGSYAFDGAAAANEERAKDLKTKYEKRGADLKNKKAVEFSIDELPELRAVSIGGGSIVTPKHTSNTLNEGFNQVSSLIDTVNAVPLPGGESYEKGFEISVGEGDYTGEEEGAKDAEPDYGYVNINKAKITAYAEITDESAKLPNINYQAAVKNSISKAIRKKISKQIIAGAGGANAVQGIFKAPAEVIPVNSDIALVTIDETTLDKIVFGYGGDEDVEGGAYLILSKLDLAAFAALRSKDGKKVYNIKLDGNKGTISSDSSYSVNFIINSACPSLSAEATAKDTYCMAYGMPMNYELPIFSALTVEESRDYKFKSGQIAYRGSIFVGGSVAAYKGFVRIKKTVAP